MKANMDDFNKCVTVSAENDGCARISCKRGLWSVVASDEATALSEARHYWVQYYCDGEYEELLRQWHTSRPPIPTAPPPCRGRRGAAMSDKKPCRWFRSRSVPGLDDRCVHPLLGYLGFGAVGLEKEDACDGCPCHEPKEDNPAPQTREDECCVWELRAVPRSLCATDEQVREYWTSCGIWVRNKSTLDKCDVCGKPVKITPPKRGHHQP